MVITGKYADCVIPKIDLYQFSIDIIKQHGDAVSMVDSVDDSKLTFKEIHNASIKLASALSWRGLKKQEIVALSCSNCIEYSLIILGVAACNAITTTCNPRYTLEETRKQFDNCKPKFVITDADQVEKMLQIAKQVSSIQEVFSVDASTKCVTLWSLIDSDDGTNFPFSTSFNVDEDVVLLPYSSGTTGMPKGVMITHKNFVAALVILRALGNLPTWVVFYTALPMFHMYGLLRLFGNFHGLKYVISKRFQPKSFFEAVEKYKINFLIGVPAILMQISSTPLAKKYDLSSLAVLTTGAAPLAPQVASSAKETMRANISQGWGLTECIMGASISSSGAPATTVGFVSPNTTLKVVDPETRRELGPNQDGEILLKGPQVMKGYYKNSRANADVFEEGYFRTGDIGHYDQLGMVYIVDRIKELIKFKGFQVAPAELESLLLTHPKVLDVGVTGIPDPDAGEVPRAFVVKKDPSVTEQELHRFVEGQVSKYKYLRGGIVFLAEIPRSVTGKILRRNLAKMSPPSKL